MKSDSLTVAEKLIVAAYELFTEGQASFSAEHLVVTAWKLFPDTFGLIGFTDEHGSPLYPDSNRIYAEIMGSKPVRRKGYIIKVGKKTYQLTESGIAYAQSINERNHYLASKKASLSREERGELKRLLAAKATEHFKIGDHQSITFYEACQFWNISPRSSAIELQGRIANLQNILSSAKAVLRGNPPVVLNHSGPMVSMGDIALLDDLNVMLQSRFEKELQTILRRTDQRL